MHYLLPDYSLSPSQIAFSLIISEYGLRHFEEAKKNSHLKWGHIAIGIVEMIPIVGIIASIIERVVNFIFQYYHQSQSQTNSQVAPKPQNPVTFVREGSILCAGNQLYCTGTVDPKKVEKICQSLNQHRKPGVYFNESLISNYVEGGTCSSMSLDYIDHYLTKRKSIDNPNKGRILNLVYDTSQRYEKGSSVEFRTRQAAFNTIQKSVQEQCKDFKKSKIKSLLKFHNRKIVYASESFNIDQANTIKKIEQMIQNLPNGVFAIRALKLDNGPKEEVHGHTTVFIKEDCEQFYYDPNEGTTYLSKIQPAQQLYDKLMAAHRQFDITDHRFYQVV